MKHALASSAISRRCVLCGTALMGGALFTAPPGFAQSAFTPPPPGSDATAALQRAIDAAAASTGALHLPAGRYRTRALQIPSGMSISGIAGATILEQAGSDALLAIADATNVTLSGLVLDGMGASGDAWHGGLVLVTGSGGVVIRDCTVHNTALHGIALHRSTATVVDCRIEACAATGLFSIDSGGIFVRGNRIADCGNGGVRIWRSDQGPDGSIVTGNRIEAIDWRDGGNGQNGNGINIFKADEVIVADNHISDCAFTAVRLNTTNNTQVRGNTCTQSGEVAIFSEFTFSGSVIADNIVDGAAAGISMTNYNEGGRLATCTGNIVRNIAPRSPVNPDTTPYGIAAEADAVISGNIVDIENGAGIVAGWGPYLRAVSITSNSVRNAEIGVAVSVAEGAGTALVADNLIAGAKRHAIAGMAWSDVVSGTLQAQASDFPQLSIMNNTIL